MRVFFIQRPDWLRLWCTGLPLEFSSFQVALSLLFGFSPRSLCSSPRLSCTAARAPRCWRRSSLTSSWRPEARRAATRRSRSVPRRRKTHLCYATSNTRSVSSLLFHIYPNATLPLTPGQYRDLSSLLDRQFPEKHILRQTTIFFLTKNEHLHCHTNCNTKRVYPHHLINCVYSLNHSDTLFIGDKI